MKLYRLGICRFSAELSGEGARINGGRWNSIGVPAVYFANSRALAVLEVLVHLPTLLLPDDFCMTEFSCEASFLEIEKKSLPENWNTFPFLKQLQLIGDRFFKTNEFPLLKVPSAVVSGEFNFILNPLHSEALKMKLVDKSYFSFDPRLF